MLSDEDMKAIEDLKDMIEKSRNLMEEEFYKLATIHNIQAVATILNLIEKQQKEIEELKENKGYHLGFIDGGIAKKYEYQDKIKAKIEEVHYKMIGHQDLREAVKQALQSLLDKE